jgi:four helix bundle protein
MRDHTSLIAWQEARAVSLAAIELSRTFWRTSVGHVFSQLLRASLSVQVNIAEGYAFTETPSFQRHLRIAYGSAVESADLLCMLIESKSVTHTAVEPVLARCRRSQQLLMGLMRRGKGRSSSAELEERSAAKSD